MDIKQDPNSIPNYNASGRIGELQPGEPEQAQSSVQLDATADGDGTASGEVTSGGGRPVPFDDRHNASPQPGVVNGAGAGRTADGREREREPAQQPDRSKTGAGAIDGLVGAP